MTMEQLRLASEASPFRQFTIHLADGRSHRVPHRDYLSLSPVGRSIVVHHSDGSGSFLDSLLITELTVDKPTTASTTESNGS